MSRAGDDAPTILWFRRDLRLADNPALTAAREAGRPVIPVYVHAPNEEAPWPPGAASRCWLDRSLRSLGTALSARGSRLVIRRSDSTLRMLRSLIHASGARQVYWNRLYEPASMARDRRIEQTLRADGVDVRTFNAALLREPWTIKTAQDRPYRVFTSYWRSCRRQLEVREPAAAPRRLPAVDPQIDGLDVDALRLRPPLDWDSGFWQRFTPGEAGAHAAVDEFVASRVEDYERERDRPDLRGTSRLSPHLHFGEIGPAQVLWACQAALAGDGRTRTTRGAEAFLRELGWREFSHHLLFHFPHTADRPMDERFEQFRWADDYAESLAAWQRGRTGIPIVDAAMRELWHTGWMHNRTRMIAASLLTKNLRIPWQQGARWFWDTLIDADLANNTQGWQWTAGCGADAAPFFRIFNPLRQAERFDPDGAYVRRWVPELAGLTNGDLQAPWQAGENELAQAGVELGRHYPAPLVALGESRAAALEAYQRIKN